MFYRATRITLSLLPLIAATASAQSVIAHRGDSLNAPGNTLSAIRSASGKADIMEMDVRRTADGELVLMHDRSVRDTTNGFGFILGMTRDRLRTLDAGAWFSPAYAGEKIPTLSEALRASVAGGMEPLVERKSGSARAYDKVFRETGLDPSSLSVMSFSRGFVRQMNRINPDYNLGVLGFGPITRTKVNRLSRYGADFVSWNHRRITSAKVDIVHARGLKLYAWTVNDFETVRRLSGLGVDGITTDDPALLKRNRLRRITATSPRSRRRPMRNRALRNRG